MTACGRIPLPIYRATVWMRGRARDLDLLAIALTCDPKPTSLMLVALARCVADARGAGY